MMNNKKVRGVGWQYCKDPNEINEAIINQDEDWEGLISSEQIISITYDTHQGCYLIFWKMDMETR